jgi:hypothetical protein
MRYILGLDKWKSAYMGGNLKLDRGPFVGVVSSTFADSLLIPVVNTVLKSGVALVCSSNSIPPAHSSTAALSLSLAS